MASTDLKTDIADSAQGPAQARGDSGSMTQHPLASLIEADRYLAAKDALADSTKRTFGIRFGKLIAPGSI